MANDRPRRTLPDIQRGRDDPVRIEAMAWANWVRDTCLRFGCTLEWAYKIAGVFAEGLERDPQCAAWRALVRAEQREHDGA